METIKNYLETMFAKMPNTPEVTKAKAELWQMMEDKYMELINEGKAENEAIGTVIAEFGNLDEILADLGIKDAAVFKNYDNIRHVTLDEVKQYLKNKAYEGYAIALGVFLCIVSCSGFLMGWKGAGTAFLFVSVAVAVGLFVFSGVVMSKWDYIKKEVCGISFETQEYVKSRQESFRVTYAMMITVGVILCILSVVPLASLERLFTRDDIGVVLMFYAIGIGVFLMVAAGVRSKSYKTILSLNKSVSADGTYEPLVKEKVYKNEKVKAVMSVYWLSVTCIYLIWSFLTFDWHITWIVWVIAALVEKVIEALYAS